MSLVWNFVEVNAVSWNFGLGLYNSFLISKTIQTTQCNTLSIYPIRLTYYYNRSHGPFLYHLRFLGDVNEYTSITI